MVCFHWKFFFQQAQFIAQSIGQAFQVAYLEFLKANGIEDHSFVKEMDYQEVLNSQEIFGDELQMFAKKELQKEVWFLSPTAKSRFFMCDIITSYDCNTNNYEFLYLNSHNLACYSMFKLCDNVTL